MRFEVHNIGFAPRAMRFLPRVIPCHRRLRRAKMPFEGYSCMLRSRVLRCPQSQIRYEIRGGAFMARNIEE